MAQKPSDPTEEELQLFKDITSSDKIAYSVVKTFDKGFALGYDRGLKKGTEWGQSGASRWWWAPSLLLSTLSAFLVGLLAGYNIVP